jgi:hypothetical protein
MVLARERFGHDAVRAQLDLPDFFENLAGNHGETAFCELKIFESAFKSRCASSAFFGR